VIGIELLAALALQPAPLDTALVQSAIDKLAAGEDPYVLTGVAPRDGGQISDLPDLKGCERTLNPQSSQRQVVVDFVCSGAEGSYAREVMFYADENGLLKIQISPYTYAIGPTQAALSDAKLPTMKSQVSRMAWAVKNNDDPTLGGIIPLSSNQIETFASLAQCKWDKERVNIANRYEWFSIVECESKDAAQSNMVTVQFDKDRRAISVRINQGTRVRRPF
jgi:hypothetical protein